MLPNWFPGDGAPPEYNSVDAALWYIHALQQYTLRIGDRCLATELYPVVTEIIDCYRQGTRHGIHVDPADGLLSAGADGVQLTWMDAKVGNHVVTPRSGKAVEVNALWYNALKIGTCFAELLGDAARSREYCRAAAQTWRGYQRFWNPSRHCLHDVIDVPAGGTDSSLRPNQILAVALHYSPLDSARQRAVVDCCARHLLTCHGLRSLAPGEPDYAPHYDGGPEARDRAYHQGTVWAWLIGPFVHAHYRVYRDAALAQSFLEPFGRHLDSHGLGTISEIFDADPPHAPHGCFAQAWSVAEVLRAWYDLNEPVSLVNPR
jgi:predicted glycogen debranching enzyme